MSSRIRRGVVVMAVVSSLCVAACASILGFDDPSLEGQDAGGDVNAIDAANDVDVVVDAGPCNIDKEFSPPREVRGITHLGWPLMRSATLSPDERIIYFHGTPEDGGIENIYVAERTDRNEAFKPPTLLRGVNAPSGPNLSPSISVNGRTLVFARDNGASSYDLFIARRLDDTRDFGAADAMVAVNSAALDQNPFLRPSVEELWFSSNRFDAGVPHIFRALASSDSFRNPVSVSISGPSTRHEAPVASADGKILFYSGDGRAGAKDNRDIWEARATTGDGPYTMKRYVDELSDDAVLDYPSWLSPDGCRLYIHKAANSTGQIWMGERER